MSNLITVQIDELASRFGLPKSGELYQVLKATAFKGEVSDAQLSALLIVSNQYGLNPWTKEIYAFPDKKNGIIPVVSIDGWARIINSNPAFDGMNFNFSDEMVLMDGAASAAPAWTECVIYRKDRSRPTIVREYLDEVYRPPFKSDKGYTVNGPWQSHPKRFSRHKSMIQCARMAFGFGGIFDQDEADRIAEAPAPASKNMGEAQVVQPGVPQDLLKKAEAAAALGVAAYQKFFTDTGPANRKLLAAEHDNLKATAIAADKARTVDTPSAAPQAKQAAPTGQPDADGVIQPDNFPSVLAMLCAAKSEEALYVAADWIDAITDADSKKLLEDKFDERLAALRGGAL